MAWLHCFSVPFSVIVKACSSSSILAPETRAIFLFVAPPLPSTKAASSVAMSMTFVTRSWFSLAGERERERERDLSSSLLRDLRRLSAERLRLRDLSSSEAIVFGSKAADVLSLPVLAGLLFLCVGDVKSSGASPCATSRLPKCKDDLGYVALSLVLAYSLQRCVRCRRA
mmetsp:Transcript_2981/g.9189  ORF Transcript_2981/g.9189 Transcript_2981/m.9189 type:complete len:170 (-) Transcript_2981:18-527(-)